MALPLKFWFAKSAMNRLKITIRGRLKSTVEFSSVNSRIIGSLPVVTSVWNRSM